VAANFVTAITSAKASVWDTAHTTGCGMHSKVGTPNRMRGILMRLITFILSSGIALACVPGFASAAPNTFHQTIVSSCPIYEGYPDCH